MTNPLNHEFDPQDLAYYLLDTFEKSPLEVLEPNVAPSTHGVYGLYHGGRVVYIGKALATGGGTTLRRRLNEHHKKIIRESSIPVSEMRCRWLAMSHDFMIDASESFLRRHYRPTWDRSGFGSHAPGRGRPGLVGPNRWERDFGSTNEPDQDSDS